MAMVPIQGWHPYAFVDRPTERLGVGVSDAAFLQPQTRPLLSLRGAGLPVLRQFMVQQPTQQFSVPKVTDVSLRGNGVYLSGGGTRFQNLSDFDNRRAGANRGVV